MLTTKVANYILRFTKLTLCIYEVNEGVRKGYPLFLCKSPNFPKLGLFNLL